MWLIASIGLGLSRPSDRLIRELRLILYALFGIALWVGMHWYGWWGSDDAKMM